MYIPSDFYHLSMDWVEAFPLHRSVPLGKAAKFHICHKDVSPLQPFPESVDPPDVDYTYSAKVGIILYIAAPFVVKFILMVTLTSLSADINVFVLFVSAVHFALYLTASVA